MGFGADLFLIMDALSAGDKADREAAITALGDAIEAQISPAGEIIAFGGTSAPTGYVECDGSELSETTEAILFAAIGTTWNTGGEAGGNFRVPDMRGAFARGTGSHGIENMADGNDFAGPAVGVFEDDRFQGHRHSFHAYNANGDTNLTTNRIIGRHAAGFKDAAPDVQMRADVIRSPTEQDDGAPREGDETRPFAAGVLYCIKT